MKLKLSTIITNVLGVLVLLSLAGGATLFAMSKPSFHWQKTAPATPAAVDTTPVAPVVTPAPVVATPEPTPAPAAPVVKTATTNSFVHLRKGPSTSTDILADLQGGTTVTLGDDANSLWQQVKYGNLTGYVYKTYLTY